MDIAILILQLKAESFIFVYCYNHFLAPRAFIKIVVIPLGIYKVAFLDQFRNGSIVWAFTAYTPFECVDLT
mgnify:CR=1 FL=1